MEPNAAYEVDCICLVLNITGAVDGTLICLIPKHMFSSLENPPISNWMFKCPTVDGVFFIFLYYDEKMFPDDWFGFSTHAMC